MTTKIPHDRPFLSSLQRLFQGSLLCIYEFSFIQKLDLITFTKILHLSSFDREKEGSLNMAYYESDSSEICLQSNP